MDTAATAGISSRVNNDFRVLPRCFTFMVGSLMLGITEVNIRNIHYLISNPRATPSTHIYHLELKGKINRKPLCFPHPASILLVRKRTVLSFLKGTRSTPPMRQAFNQDGADRPRTRVAAAVRCQ